MKLRKYVYDIVKIVIERLEVRRSKVVINLIGSYINVICCNTT
jgi:hypothetical protein